MSVVPISSGPPSGQNIARDDKPVFNTSSTFIFDGKVHVPKPISYCQILQSCCCPCCCPIESQYYSSAETFVAYGTESCCCFEQKYVKLDGDKVGQYQNAGMCDNGLMYCLGLKCSGEIKTGFLKVDGERTYEMRKTLSCCGSCCFCFEMCQGCCCSPPWEITEQPIYKCGGEEVGQLRTIQYKGTTQNAIADVPGVPRNHKAVVSLLPFMALSALGIVGGGAPFQQGTRKELGLRIHHSSFKDMLTQAGIN